MLSNSATVKTSVSLPEDVVHAISQVASDRHASRNAVIEDALRAYLDGIESREMLESLDAAYDEPVSAEDEVWLEFAARETAQRLNAMDGGWPIRDVLSVQVEKLADKRHTSTDAIVSAAVEMYLKRAAADDLTAAFNEVYGDTPLSDEERGWLDAAARETFARVARDEDEPW